MSAHDLDVLIIGGGGSGGFTAATTAMKAGVRVGMVEAGRLGGLCILAGCMPSKALLHAAAAQHAAPRPLAQFYPGLMARKREVVDYLAGRRVQAVQAKQAKGLELITGRASFIDAHTVAVDGRPLRAAAIVVATGSAERLPDLPGLEEAGFLTAESLMEAPALPASLAVLGGGAIALEMAQYAARLGVAVTVLQRSGRLLSAEDAAVGQVLRAALEADGVSVLTGVELTGVEAAAGTKTVRYRQDGAPGALQVADILVALGRQPNSEGLNLAAAGVATARGAVVVDQAMRTNVPHIFAAGDVTGVNMVVNLAVLQGEVAGHNAARLHETPRLVDDRVLPRAVFTDPQFARVGLSREQCQAAGLDFVEASQELSSMGLARIYPRPVPGFLSMRAAKADGLILGAELVAPEASLMIHDLAVAMKLRGRARDIAEIPYIHPCLSEITPSVAEKLAWLVAG